MNKRSILALVSVIGLFGVMSLATPVFANDPQNITVYGNQSAGNYTIEAINTTQLNLTINSGQYTWFRYWINISLYNGTGAATVTHAGSAIISHINITLPDTWVANSTSNVILLNSTSDVILETGNTSYSEDSPGYGRIMFNLTNYEYNGTTATTTANNVTITNTSAATMFKLFAIDFKVDTLDTHRTTAVTSSSNTFKTVNVTWTAPSNITVENITVYYSPSDFSTWDTVQIVNANGTTFTEGTDTGTYSLTATGLRLNSDWDFQGGGGTNSTFLKISYTIPESSKGGTGAGASAPTAAVTTAAPITGSTLAMVGGVALIVIVAVLVILAHYKKI